MTEFCLDGGAMFGIVPKNLWEKKIPADEHNRIPMKSRSLLIQGNNKNILVDTGCGTKFNDKLKKIYGISGNQPDIAQQFNKYGINKFDITDVILTHLHFDHCGGAVETAGGQLVPSFPNATYHVQEKQWGNSITPTIRERGSYFENDFLPLLEHGVLNIITENKSPFKDIDMIISNGHTPGQILPLIKGNNKKMLFSGDMFPTSAHIRETWHMGYDINPATIIEEKTEILFKAVEEEWILFFEHDPVEVAARLKRVGRNVEISETFEF